MAATSNHIGDVGLWLEKVIDSCETPQQETIARKLVSLFRDRLLREDSEFYGYYDRTLRDRLDAKFYARLQKTQSDANSN
jgi:hypothetical protein